MIGSFLRMPGQVLLLVAAQALFQTASTLVMTIGALVGAQVSPTPQLATAPIAAMFLGTVLTTIPASHSMARFGRRSGFVAGALLGALGGITGAWGIYSRSLLVLSLGTLLIGAYTAFAQFYRFAAAEVAEGTFRPRAIAWVLGGGVVAAIVGPALATLGGPLLEPAYVGSFLILSAVSLIAASLLSGLRAPLAPAEMVQVEPRPLRAIMRQPAYAVALFAAATGSGSVDSADERVGRRARYQRRTRSSASAARARMSTATTPSSHQWLAVAATTTRVTIGWASTSHRHRLEPISTAATPTRTAQPTCSDGMAESWSLTPVPTAVYTDWP